MYVVSCAVVPGGRDERVNPISGVNGMFKFCSVRSFRSFIFTFSMGFPFVGGWLHCYWSRYDSGLGRSDLPKLTETRGKSGRLLRRASLVCVSLRTEVVGGEDWRGGFCRSTPQRQFWWRFSRKCSCKGSSCFGLQIAFGSDGDFD